MGRNVARGRAQGTALGILWLALGCTSAREKPLLDSDPAPGGAEGGGEGSGPDDTGAPPDWPAGATVLDHARVVDAAGVREDAAVLIVGDSVWGVTEAGQGWPADATVVELGGASVTPGLIDSHVHLFHAGVPWWVGDTLEANLRAQLAWGVLGVADLGSPVEIYALRDRVAEGSLRGPRIWATGPFLTAVGSHPCESVADDALCRFVDGDGAAAVAELAGADGIKVALADAAFTAWPTPRLDLGDLAEIVAAGKPVFAHIDAPEDARDAVAAGVAVLAHPVFSEDLSSSPDAPVESTLSAFSGTLDLLSGDLLAEDLSQTPAAVRAAWAWLEDHPEQFSSDWVSGSRAWTAHSAHNVAVALGEGATVLAGSDAGYYYVPHGLALHRELEGLVAAGATPLEALAAATARPAQILGWDDLGYVAAGYHANLLVVPGAPDEDIAALRDIQAIYLDGELWTGEDLWVSAGPGGAGDFCLNDQDCSLSRCDQVTHRCSEACAEPYDRVGSCDEETWCAPQDGLDSTTAGVCRAADDCDLYAQDCAPEDYGESCAPVDLDSNVCWPAGPQRAGEVCSWSDPDLYCAQGLFCSWISYRCYTLCDPDDPRACAGCTRQTIEGHPWFGLCL